MRHTLALIFVAVATVAACTSSEPEWSAFVYPDRSAIPPAQDAHRYIVGRFLSFEQCQAAAVAAVNANQQRTGTEGDYQCGHRCSHRENLGGLYVCEKNAK
jgi:hypothetical protein